MSNDKKVAVITGFKATDKDMRCRGFQFELGVWHKHDGIVTMCESGFHFCEYPSGPWSYYSQADSRIFEVEARGVLMGEGPGADLKHVATEIRLIKEIICTGDRNSGDGNFGHGNSGDGNSGDGNTGYRNSGDGNSGDGNSGDGNTGDRNSGHGNTGDRNTGDGNFGHRNSGIGNTGHRNTGRENTGYKNTGDENTGYRNTGNKNTGDGNTGNKNTGHRNTGVGNCTDNCSGFLCSTEQPVRIFDASVKEPSCVDYDLIRELSEIMSRDEDISDIDRFLTIPNSSVKKIMDLHKLHKEKRLWFSGNK